MRLLKQSLNKYVDISLIIRNIVGKIGNIVPLFESVLIFIGFWDNWEKPKLSIIFFFVFGSKQRHFYIKHIYI